MAYAIASSDTTTTLISRLQTNCTLSGRETIRDCVTDPLPMQGAIRGGRQRTSVDWNDHRRSRKADDPWAGFAGLFSPLGLFVILVLVGLLSGPAFILLTVCSLNNRDDPQQDSGRVVQRLPR